MDRAPPPDHGEAGSGRGGLQAHPLVSDLAFPTFPIFCDLPFFLSLPPSLLSLSPLLPLCHLMPSGSLPAYLPAGEEKGPSSPSCVFAPFQAGHWFPQAPRLVPTLFGPRVASGLESSGGQGGWGVPLAPRAGCFHPHEAEEVADDSRELEGNRGAGRGVSRGGGGGALPDCPGEAWVGRLPGLHGPNCRLPSAPRETPTHDRSLMGEVESRGSVSLISEKSTL